VEPIKLEKLFMPIHDSYMRQHSYYHQLGSKLPIVWILIIHS